MNNKLEELVGKYHALGIDRQLDYEKFYLYSIITHSTAIEGSTITEVENQIMFDNGIALKGKTLIEQNMNLDLRAAYERALTMAREHAPITVDSLKELSALTMRNTGTTYHTMLGNFSSADGDLRLLNVTAGIGGRSYMSFNKVPTKLSEFCDALNLQRKQASSMTMQELYEMSFDAHFNLVTIHPWADGNGRMARLLMNLLQFEFNLIPSRIFADDKEEYIKSLINTREAEDLSIFRRFMTRITEQQIARDIDAFIASVGDTPTESLEPRTANKILALIAENPHHSARTLAQAIGISPKGIEKHLSKLKLQGKITRIGSPRSGQWQLLTIITKSGYSEGG